MKSIEIKNCTNPALASPDPAMADNKLVVDPDLSYRARWIARPQPNEGETG